jgi:hypothetical protein
MIDQPRYKRVAKPLLLKLQKNCKLFPREFCLITGAPRSGTSAVGDWLGHQRGVLEFHESRILVSAHDFIKGIDRFANLYKENAKVIALVRQLVWNYYSNSRILIGKRLLIDKEPLEPIAFPLKDYGAFIANVRALFPEVKFLFIIRDPVATIWSMTQRTWGESLAMKEAKTFSIEEHIDNWRACADLILQNQSNPDTYVVQFGRLTRDPENESRRIFDFLNIRRGDSFRALQTKETDFRCGEREMIMGLVQQRLELLNTKGISEI